MDAGRSGYTVIFVGARRNGKKSTGIEAGVRKQGSLLQTFKMNLARYTTK